SSDLPDGLRHHRRQGHQGARHPEKPGRERGDQCLHRQDPVRCGRRNAGLAVPVQERDPQPPHRDRALRRRGHLHRRRHPGPAFGRSYVYQAMRVTGAGDPLVPVKDTMSGKLPQRKLVTTAAQGYSSYGNQIGLATGQVDELYHPGYVAKRMEIGAVVGATPASHVRRETPAPGDVVILLGGRTGRDGIGGATGSSKAHKLSSLETCGAEVQKGNAPIERKLQRLFRREDACKLIKRCNDFGAGGVSVAIGELADGLRIDLNKVTKKYEGLDGTELAISESQERMAVAVAAEDAETFIGYAHEENLEATIVATVTEEKRMREIWNGKAIVDLSREFLNSNGAERHANVHILPGH